LQKAQCIQACLGIGMGVDRKEEGWIPRSGGGTCPVDRGESITPCMRLCPHPGLRPWPHSYPHPCPHVCVHFFIRAFIHSFICSCVCLFFHAYVRLSLCAFRWTCVQVYSHVSMHIGVWGDRCGDGWASGRPGRHAGVQGVEMDREHARGQMGVQAGGWACHTAVHLCHSMVSQKSKGKDSPAARVGIMPCHHVTADASTSPHKGVDNCVGPVEPDE
jgi:hypothetical protein